MSGAGAFRPTVADLIRDVGDALSQDHADAVVKLMTERAAAKKALARERADRVRLLERVVALDEALDFENARSFLELTALADEARLALSLLRGDETALRSTSVATRVATHDEPQQRKPRRKRATQGNNG